ncbi:MAG TPA: isopentenyl-diphosphate Delta-isomerase [Pseudonocardiaceae bacterium]|nr:isopentenyl-diphosphate Delta-isomerase [Pseudonocardiaceae bacterium]
MTVSVDRETLLVELVDDAGDAAGSCSVAEAHEAPGRLHRAFSVMLIDPDGRMLLQRRAAVKTRFALRWANSCCGHPAPGQDPLAAARDRMADELGVDVDIELRDIGAFVYQASDAATARVEYEWDHVLVGTVTDLALDPDPAEVAECGWVAPADLKSAMDSDPDSYTPWLPPVLELLAGQASHHVG